MALLFFSTKVGKVVALVVGLGAVALGAFGSYQAGILTSGFYQDAVVEDDSEHVTTDSASREVPPERLAPLRVPTCSIAEAVSEPELGQFFGIVVDPSSGEVMFDRSKDGLISPASVQKLLTAAAALISLGPDATFETSTWLSRESASLFLKAGGDLTLGGADSAEESVYIGAAKLQALVDQTILGLELAGSDTDFVVSSIVVDQSIWDHEDNWREAWDDSARSKGYISRVTALQIDGDRFDPSRKMGRRSDDPVSRAVKAFTSALGQEDKGLRNLEVSFGSLPMDAERLAAVESRPVDDLIDYMLKESDNTIAEMLGRHVSIARGLGGSGDSIQEAILGTLEPRIAVDSGLRIDDSSGLSELNRLNANFVADLLSEIYRDQSVLRPLLDSLPISGVDGSLRDRFTEENSQAVGRVRAKTGSIAGTRSLAGVVQAADDLDLVFAFFATGEVDDGARYALEKAVVSLFQCGANLGNF